MNADKGEKTVEREKERAERVEGDVALSIFIPSAFGINFTIINCGDIINSSLDRLS